ncbi:MAG: threonine--tRNA ligase [Armatimonadetes bacterium]|nr:threonine--tRNA ligase [Armatimonadota bacterium]
MATINVHLPDGSDLSVPSGVALTTVAQQLGLDGRALAAKVDGQPADLSSSLDRDAEVRFLTWDDDEGKLVYRHSSAHVLAQAVQALFPEAQVTIGPALEDGRFYYDFDMPRPFTPDDLVQIEAKIAEIIAADQAFARRELSRDDAHALFAGRGEKYKLEILADIPADEQVSIYWNDDAWVDLCRGVHVPSTGRLGVVKLLSTSAAYWRGDSDREMLQRVYGTSFPTAAELAEYLELRAEAERRDHRKLGRDLDLVWFDDVAPASPFFFPDGAFIYNQLVALIRSRYAVYGYQEVITPQILSVELWEKSGHLAAYRENMYFTELDGRQHAVKPMNCPGHVMMFGSRRHSYRDLPIRYADFGRLHRYEPSGVTAGLTRVRTFCQDDAHIFCRPDQIDSEVNAFCDLLLGVYGLFGFSDVEIHLSTRPDKSVGSDEIWESAGRALQQVLDARGVGYRVARGEGAFYGPKIDFLVSDALRRRHQLGTCQLDFSMPDRFGVSYVTADDQRATPVMIHRALLGSIERFMGILIEHTGGVFPAWLAPTQVVLVPVAARHVEYLEQVAAELRAAGFRANLDAGEERVSAKIAAAEARKIPYMLVAGDREAGSGAVSVRERGMHDHGAMPVAAFVDKLAREAGHQTKASTP